MARRFLRITPSSSILFLALVIVVALAGCGASGGGGLYGTGSNNTGGNAGSGASATTTCANSSVLICTRSIKVNGVSKNALVNRDGKTLYYFTSDTATTVACTSAQGCITTWPPLLSTSVSVAPIAGLTGTMTTVSRGSEAQVAYNGHPLYTYAADSAPGDTKGNGLFGKWFVATVDLAPASGSGGNGYGAGY